MAVLSNRTNVIMYHHHRTTSCTPSIECMSFIVKYCISVATQYISYRQQYVCSNKEMYPLEDMFPQYYMHVSIQPLHAC